MKAIKLNRVYTITEADVEAYKRDGYDIYNDAGDLVEYGAGKQVSYETYMHLMEDYERILEENAVLQSELSKAKTSNKKKEEK